MGVAQNYSTRTLDVLSALGRQIAAARRAQRRTQADIAERAGITVPTLREIEKGSPNVRVGLVFEVAAIVGIPLVEAAEGEPRRLIESRYALLPSRIVPPKDDDNDF